MQFGDGYYRMVKLENSAVRIVQGDVCFRLHEFPSLLHTHFSMNRQDSGNNMKWTTNSFVFICGAFQLHPKEGRGRVRF
jgi:hypothetical protein